MQNDKYFDARIIASYDPEEQHYLTPTVITIGRNAKANDWEPSKSIPHVKALFDFLAHHPVANAKDGLALVLGELIPGPRNKTAVTKMYAMGFDLDRGTHPELIDAAMVKLGHAALRYTSFSNGKTLSEFPRDAVTKFVKCDKEDLDTEAMQRYVREQLKWVEEIAATVELADIKQTSDGWRCIIKHAPIPKNRVIIPFDPPFVPGDYENLQAATEEWKGKYFAVAESMGLREHIDPTGADLNRLYYFPRHPKGAPHDTTIAGGPLLDWRDVKVEKTATKSGAKKAKSITPEGRALGKWSSDYASRFLIADLIENECDDKDRGYASAGRTIECPFDLNHSNPGDQNDAGCFAVNADEGKGDIFTIFCQHNSCRGYTMLDHLGKMLADEWFPRDVLESDDYNALPDCDNGPATGSKTVQVSTRSGDTALALPDGLDLVSNTGEIKPTFANALILLEEAHGQAWGFAFDEMAQVPMLRGDDLPWAQKFGRELDDGVIRVIRHFLIEQWGVTFRKDDVYEACVTLAGYTRFNPLVEYLDSLEWDGTPRVETWLANYLGVEDTPYARAVGKIWPVAAVRRAKNPGCKFDNMPIFEGLGGVGKSTALNVLAGDGYFSDAPLGDVENKDAAIILQNRWIVEMGELSNMSRSATEAMLAFVSRKVDRYRAPHDKTAKNHPRMCVFAGTTNKDNYLTATTGNRRYWPVKCGDEIKLDDLARDRDQIWAEAVELEKTGMSLILDKELWPVAREEQTARVASDPWADELREYLEGLARDKVSTRELLTIALGIDVVQQNDRMMKRLRDVMTTIEGWQHKTSLRIADGDGTTKVRAGYERKQVEAVAAKGEGADRSEVTTAH